MTEDEITLRIVKQELELIVKYYEGSEDDSLELMSTMVDRCIDLSDFIDRQCPLPPVFAWPWVEEELQ